MIFSRFCPFLCDELFLVFRHPPLPKLLETGWVLILLSFIHLNCTLLWGCAFSSFLLGFCGHRKRFAVPTPEMPTYPSLLSRSGISLSSSDMYILRLIQISLVSLHSPPCLLYRAEFVCLFVCLCLLFGCYASSPAAKVPGLPVCVPTYGDLDFMSRFSAVPQAEIFVLVHSP